MEQTSQTIGATLIGGKDSAGSAEAARINISARFLLGIYAIIPICFLAMVLDLMLGGGVLLRGLPTSPESFFVFQILFGTPHIIASSVILTTNTDYLWNYRVRILLFTLFVILFFGIGSYFISYYGFLALVGSATVIHVIKQQVGIGKGICRLSARIYDFWGWTLIAFGSVLYYALYAHSGFSAGTAQLVNGALWLFGSLALVLTVVCHTRIKSRLGRLYLWANAAMVLQSGLFYAWDYPFLAILGPRLVHDLTAFSFYVAHDVNRHRRQPQNLLYRLTDKLGLGVFWVCPAVAVLLTFLISSYSEPFAKLFIRPVLGFELPYALSFMIIGYLGLLHYYTESFTWQKDSPYRRFIALGS